jgi:hypothetical protein
MYVILPISARKTEKIAHRKSPRAAQKIAQNLIKCPDQTEN